MTYLKTFRNALGNEFEHSQMCGKHNVIGLYGQELYAHCFAMHKN